MQILRLVKHLKEGATKNADLMMVEARSMMKKVEAIEKALWKKEDLGPPA